MPRRRDEDVIAEVCARIDEAIRENRHRERVIVAVLVLMVLVGLGLIVYGAAKSSWQLLAPGSVLQVAVVLPIRRLIKLREDNVRLQILPQLLRLAETQEAKALAARLVNRLIEQV